MQASERSPVLFESGYNVAVPVEILRSTQSYQAVGICELCKDANFVAVLELRHKRGTKVSCACPRLATGNAVLARIALLVLGSIDKQWSHLATSRHIQGQKLSAPLRKGKKSEVVKLGLSDKLLAGGPVSTLLQTRLSLDQCTETLAACVLEGGQLGRGRKLHVIAFNAICIKFDQNDKAIAD